MNIFYLFLARLAVFCVFTHKSMYAVCIYVSVYIYKKKFQPFFMQLFITSKKILGMKVYMGLVVKKMRLIIHFFGWFCRFCVSKRNVVFKQSKNESTLIFFYFNVFNILLFYTENTSENLKHNFFTHPKMCLF